MGRPARRRETRNVSVLVAAKQYSASVRQDPSDHEICVIVINAVTPAERIGGAKQASSAVITKGEGSTAHLLPNQPTKGVELENGRIESAYLRGNDSTFGIESGKALATFGTDMGQSPRGRIIATY